MNDLVELKKEDLEKYALETQNSQQVLSLTKELKLNDPTSILVFGSKPAEELARMSDTILRNTKDVKNEKASNVLNRLSFVVNYFLLKILH